MPEKKFRFYFLIIGVLLGILVGALGTTLHRSAPPWGLILAIVATAALSVAARSLMSWAGLISAVVGWAIAVQWLALEGPAGDVLIAGDGLGYGWLLGGILALFVGLLLPATFFQDRRRDAKGSHITKE
ncbi:MAG TPA: DUF6113 family protein [Actinomycetales bacterium]|nr:DUF6113 family protein [Actinomycetales bacterium]